MNLGWHQTPEAKAKKKAYDAERKAWATPERKAYMKAWHKANPRNRKAYKAAYDASHQAENAAYRAANSERIKAAKVAWYAANRERVIANVRRHYEAKTEQLRAYGRQYYADNPEQAKANVARRKARVRGATGSHTLQEWQAKCAEYHGLCAYCGEAKPLTRDHVVPVSAGGSDDIENIVPACASCNSRKRTRPAEEFRRSLDQRAS